MTQSGYDFSKTTIYVVVGILAIFALAFKKYREKERIQELDSYAQDNHYKYFEKPDDSLLERFNDFKSFKWISSERLFNMLVADGKDKNPDIITAKKTDSGNNNAVQYTQVFFFNSGKEIPRFFIKKKNYFEKFVNGLDKRVIKNLKLTNFSIIKFQYKPFPVKNYFCFAEGENFEEFLSNDFIDLLNNGIERRKKKINIESDGRSLIFFVHNRRHSKEDIDYYINLFAALKNRLIS